MEQTRETQLAKLYNVVGFRRAIARYDILRPRHETGPRSPDLFWNSNQTSMGNEKKHQALLGIIFLCIFCLVNHNLNVQ